LIISVLQNHSRSFFSLLSPDFAKITLENTEIRCFYPVLPNESDSKMVIDFNVMVSSNRF
jgi:hypothetical protein